MAAMIINKDKDKGKGTSTYVVELIAGAIQQPPKPPPPPPPPQLSSRRSGGYCGGGCSYYWESQRRRRTSRISFVVGQSLEMLLLLLLVLLPIHHRLPIGAWAFSGTTTTTTGTAIQRIGATTKTKTTTTTTTTVQPPQATTGGRNQQGGLRQPSPPVSSSSSSLFLQSPSPQEAQLAGRRNITPTPTIPSYLQQPQRPWLLPPLLYRNKNNNNKDDSNRNTLRNRNNNNNNNNPNYRFRASSSRRTRLWATKLSSSSDSSSSSSTTTTTTTPVSKTQSRRRSTTTGTSDTTATPAPAIGGAEFFGGKKEKEEFYDPQEEAKVVVGVAGGGGISTATRTAAAADTSTSTTTTTTRRFHRFADRTAFSNVAVAQIVQQLQQQINQVLYDDADNADDLEELAQVDEKWVLQGYATSTRNTNNNNNFKWITPFESVYMKDKVQKKTNDNNDNDNDALPNPLQVLKDYALQDFERIDVALTAGQECSLRDDDNDNDDNDQKTLQLSVQWEISLAWSQLVWEPRVLLLGSSQLTLTKSPDGWIIVQQKDELFGGIRDNNHKNKNTNNNHNDDRASSPSFLRHKYLIPQLLPQFWDLYHIGMTPSAERVEPLVLERRRTWQLVAWPGRWHVTATLSDARTLDRTQLVANVLPSHAFGMTALSTVGPTQQRFIPTTPLEIQISVRSTTAANNNNNNNGGAPRIQWQVPVSVELQSQITWPPALTTPSQTDDDDDNDENNGENDQPGVTAAVEKNCQYTWVGPRLVAMAPFAGTGPQDDQIPQARQALYQAVVADDYDASSSKYRPKLDPETQRPCFTFWKRGFKGCFTANGLGMAVYEWRPNQWPAVAQNHFIGLELELSSLESSY